MDQMIDRVAEKDTDASLLANAIVDETPISLEDFLSRATDLIRSGRLPDAASICREGIARYPDADELADAYAWISHEVGDIAFGTAHWRHLRIHSPDNLDGYLGGGLASRRAGAFEAADRIYELGIERFPDNPTLQIDYAWSAEDRGDYSEAARRWSLVRERFADAPEGTIRTGIALMAAGQLSEAEAALADAVERYPDDMEALTEYAWVAHAQRQWPEALARWGQLILRYPESLLPRRLAAAALVELSRFREAATVLAPALRLYPDDLELGITRAWIATHSDASLALELWENIRTRAPERIEGYHGAAAALIEARRLDEADALLTAAVERFSSVLAAATEWASLPEKREDWDSAATRWATVIARFPDSAESYAGMSNVLISAIRLAEAEALLKEAATRFPNDIEIAIASARAAERADWPEALIRWKAVKTRFPDVPIGYSGYGRILRELGELGGAVHQLRQGVKRFPDDMEVNLELAVTLGALRDWPQALAEWDTLKRRYPENRILAGYLHREVALALADQAQAGGKAFDIPPGLLEASNLVDTPTSERAEILTRFDSLGDSCEFAMFQRLNDVEHLSLLRWARTSPDNLIRALDAGLEGVGDPENTLITQLNGEYITEDRRYGMRAHTFTSTNAEPLSEFAPEQCRRIRWLKGRLLMQLTAGGKVYVYTTGHEDLSRDQAVALFEALQRYSERNSLLCVRVATPDHPPGSIEKLQRGLWVGYLDKFSVVDISVTLWLTLCRAVLQQIAVGE